MNAIIPFKKKVNFESDVYEVCSISLDHTITKNEGRILGDFLINGTYREREFSDEKDFSFTIPFEVALERNIDESSLTFDIDDFTYEVSGNNLEVNITYVLDALDRDVIDFVEDRKDELMDLFKEKTTPKAIESPVLEDVVTYHVHTIKKEETVEMICSFYNISVDDINRLNENFELIEGKRILVPIYHD